MRLDECEDKPFAMSRRGGAAGTTKPSHLLAGGWDCFAKIARNDMKMEAFMDMSLICRCEKVPATLERRSSLTSNVGYEIAAIEIASHSR
jgi:hypothetical protein